MIGETGENVNKIFICGEKEFIHQLSEEFWHVLDIPSITFDINSPYEQLFYRQISNASCVIIHLEEINAKSLLVMGIAKGLNKLIVGVGSEEFYNDDPTDELTTIASELCEFQTLDEDVIGEVQDYI